LPHSIVDFGAGATDGFGVGRVAVAPQEGLRVSLGLLDPARRAQRQNASHASLGCEPTILRVVGVEQTQCRAPVTAT
jgi:hypothetical protein